MSTSTVYLNIESWKITISDSNIQIGIYTGSFTDWEVDKPVILSDNRNLKLFWEKYKPIVISIAQETLNSNIRIQSIIEKSKQETL